MRIVTFLYLSARQPMRVSTIRMAVTSAEKDQLRLRKKTRPQNTPRHKVLFIMAAEYS